ncbi:hypothetical protein ACFLQX_00500 [Bacteroidota bacterium]
MKDLLKNLGLIVIIAGVILLSIVVFRQTHSNTELAISLVLIVIGLFGHIILNKFID